MGSDNVLAAILPYNTTGPEVLKDAETVRDLLGLPSVTIDITEVVDNCYRALFAATGEEPDKVRLGNIMARQRMILLYDLSAAISGLVIGTSNKTELLLGYGTLHGDLAFAFDPLGDLYKTQIRAYARYLGVPENIVTKPPSADFWVGQTDEEDLGFTYDDLDKSIIDDRGAQDNKNCLRKALTVIFSMQSGSYSQNKFRQRACFAQVAKKRHRW